MTLKDALVGNYYRITKIEGTGSIKRRIMDMGLTKGTKLYIRKMAPLGDPIQIQVRGYELTLRKEDARMVRIEEYEPDRKEG